MFFWDFLIIFLFAIVKPYHYLNSFPKHEFGRPSQDLIAIYHSGFESRREEGQSTPHKSPIIRMNIKAKKPCINVDNLFGLESVDCINNDGLHLRMKSDLSIDNWNISNGIVFLVNSRWRCMGKEEALFLQTTSCNMISAREFIFKVSHIHPKDVINEYEFVIRPNNEYHRNLLFYDRVSEKQNNSREIQRPFNYSYSGPLVDTRLLSNSTINNYFQIFCDKCVVQGSTELTARIKGPGIFKKAQAVIETGIGSALNLNLSLVLKSIGKFLGGINWSQKIFKSKLFSWSVPGIFSPDVSFNIDLSTSLFPLSEGISKFMISLTHDYSKIKLQSHNGTFNISSDTPVRILSANSSSQDNNPGLSFIGSINFSPSISASISFFKVSVPLVGISYSTGISAAIDTIKKSQKCIFNSFQMHAFSNFKGSIGNFSRDLVSPLIKNLTTGCLDNVNLIDS